MRPIATLTVLLAATSVTAAADPAPRVVGLTAFPKAVALNGGDDAPQLLITGLSDTGRETDLTTDARYAVADARIVRVDADGRLAPLANGATTITATAAGHAVTVPVTVSGLDAPRPINFTNQIEPVLTKLGCNGGGCHGKIAGQNGFRLSLMGFDPELDYVTLVKESRGRRLFPAAPDRSLLLQKAAGVVPHGGGRKTDVGSDEYNLLRRWVATGAPFGRPTDPALVRVEVTPAARVIDRDGRQQLAVRAYYSDGSVEDVTRRAQYETNEPDVAAVGEAGLVRAQARTGQAAVMVRFAGLVTVFRAVVPRPGPAPQFAWEPKTVVDEFTAKKWRELGLAPSGVCSDQVFVRRVFLDVTGTLPTADTVRAFAADPDPAKRDKLVDRLLETREYAYLFAGKWADVLRVKRRDLPERAAGTATFHAWIKDAVAADKPYDEFAREILCATGDDAKSPPTVWYKEVTTPEQFVDDVSQVFLGQRLACANCHHHPYEKWGQDDYWGLAAFFARVGTKDVPADGVGMTNQKARTRRAVFVKSEGTVTNKRTNRAAVMKPLDGPPVDPAADEDPRAPFSDWLTAPTNPYFARAVANRYWAHFFGRGIVDTIDDMRATNPPSNPELLDALAKTVTDSGYSLKALVRVICKSRTYQLDSAPTEYNAADRQSFARYYPRRLPAEVVYDAVSEVTGTPSDFPGLPKDRYAPARALMLPDEGFQSYFLDVLGRPQRVTACECERTTGSSLAMTLHLLNGKDVQDKIGRGTGRAARLAADPRPVAEKVGDLFLLAFGKAPTADQLKLVEDYLAKHQKDAKLAYENVLWAIVNSKTFLFNQ